MGKRVIFGGATILFLIGLFLFIAGFIFEYVAFPAILKHQVKKSLVLGLKDDGELNEFADDWLNSKYTVKMEYYIFNYTNALEMVNRGMLPDAVERGPYTYVQVNSYPTHNFSDDGDTLEYREESWYYFDPSSSCTGCDPEKDFVIIPDLIFFTLFDSLSELLPLFGLPPSVTSMLSSILKLVKIPLIGYKSGPFIQVNVDALIMRGYVSPFINMLEQIDLSLNQDSSTGSTVGGLLNFLIEYLISLPPIALNQNNGTTDQTFFYTIKTGKENYEDVGRVIALRKNDQDPKANSTQYLANPFWTGASPDCADPEFASELRGTNGDYFAPFVKKDTKLSAYIEDVCRSLDFVFEQESKVGEIDTYRFIIDPSAFNYSVAENCGFCSTVSMDMYNKQAGNYCLPDGLLDASNCKGPGIILSNPHFYGAARIVQNWFPRLKPDPSIHQTYLDIEPTTGTVLAAQKRLQVNFLAGKSMAPYALIPSGAYPVAWVDNTYYADDKTLKKVKDDLITPQKIVKLLCFIVGVGLGALLMIIAIAICIIRQVHFSHRSPSSLASTLNHQAQTMESPPIYRPRDDGTSVLTKRVLRPQNQQPGQNEW